MKHISMRTVIGIVVGLAVIGISLTFLFNRVRAQDDIAVDLTARLQQQGVPVKDVAVTGRVPFRVKITLQSTSDAEKVAPGDPIFEHAAHREVVLAQRRNDIKFDVVKIIIVNTQGTPIYWSDVPVSAGSEKMSPPSEPNDAAISEVVREELVLHGISLEDLSVSSDAESVQTLTIRLSVPDIQTANSALPQFMLDLPALLEKLNAEKGTQIAICKIDLVDAAGQLLLRYVKDLQLSQENWWQADGVTQEWFPHPPPGGPVEK